MSWSLVAKHLPSVHRSWVLSPSRKKGGRIMAIFIPRNINAKVKMNALIHVFKI
jgi:hypothetical protein